MAMTNEDKAKILACSVSFMVANGGVATSNELWNHFLSCKLPLRREFDRRMFPYVINEACVQLNKKRWGIRRKISATESKDHIARYYLERNGVVYE